MCKIIKSACHHSKSWATGKGLCAPVLKTGVILCIFVTFLSQKLFNVMIVNVLGFF